MKYEKLRRVIERQLHRSLKSPADFEYAAEEVAKKTGEIMSITTLMRLWGYRHQVDPRPSTLDILARFIGYENYSHFLIAKEKEDEAMGEIAAEEDMTEYAPEDSSPKRRWLWPTVATIVLALIIMGGVFLHLRHGATQREAVYVTSLGQLSNYRQYYIHTRNRKRGTLGIDSHQLATTYEEAKFYRCDTASTFAIIHYEGSYYLYNVARQRFINVLFAETNDPLRKEYAEKNWCAIDIHPEEGHFVMDFWGDTAAGRVFTLNVNSGNGLIITDWGTMNGIYDDGNLFSFEDAGPFDPVDAMEMLKKSQIKTNPKIGPRVV